MVSPSKQRELQWNGTEIINYFLEYSPYDNWNFIAGRLYYLEQPRALSKARTFLKETRGECMCDTILSVYYKPCHQAPLSFYPGSKNEGDGAKFFIVSLY